MADLVRRALLQVGIGCLASVATASAATPELAVGQEWSVKDLSGAKVIVGRIETYGGVAAVSVSIVGLNPAKGPAEIDHAPFEKKALMASLDQLLATDVRPALKFEDGYRQWKAAKGGVFTVNVAELPGLLDSIVRTSPGPNPRPSSARR